MLLEYFLFLISILSSFFILIPKNNVSVVYNIVLSLLSSLVLIFLLTCDTNQKTNNMLLTLLWSSFILITSVNNKNQNKQHIVLCCLVVIIVSGLCLLNTTSLFILIFSFEFMLLGAIGLLWSTSKTERAVEAIMEMYVWAVVGSVFLLTGLTIHVISKNYILTNFNELNFLCSLFCMLGFAVKVPLWPFTSWLLKAHVEASTEFSIFLSGFLVKFGVVGLIKTIFLLESHESLRFLTSLSLIGLIEASFRILAQVDLKRIVATTTLIETNWIVICLSSCNYTLESIGCWLIIVHAFTTTSEFFLVEVIYKRYGLRSVFGVSGLWLTNPNLSKLLIGSLLTTIGLPGSSIFFLKFLFLIFYFKISVIVTILLSIIFLILLPIFFIRTWSLIIGGQPNISNNVITDISLKELTILVTPIIFSIIVGLNPTVMLV